MADIHAQRAVRRRELGLEEGGRFYCYEESCECTELGTHMVRRDERWFCLPHADPRDVVAQVEFLHKRAVLDALKAALQQMEPVLAAIRVGFEKGRDQDTPSMAHLALEASIEKAPFNFAAFCEKVRDTMSGTAVTKGYNDTGPDGPNPLDDFCGSFFPNHRLGEVVYKCVRFTRKRLPEDLEKAAAWLFLEWREAQCGVKGHER